MNRILFRSTALKRIAAEKEVLAYTLGATPAPNGYWVEYGRVLADSPFWHSDRWQVKRGGESNWKSVNDTPVFITDLKYIKTRG